MRKSLAVLAVLGAFSVAGAHDFWLAGQNDDKLRVQIGFGDGFATCEPIDKQRENNFEIPVVIDKNGKKIELKRTSENSINLKAKSSRKASILLPGNINRPFGPRIKAANGIWAARKIRSKTLNFAVAPLCSQRA